MVRTNWFFDEWTEAFGSERLTGGLLGRAAHHIHIHILGRVVNLSQSVSKRLFPSLPRKRE